MHRHPNLFIIGASKCGTTTIHDMIAKSPEVCSSKYHKEPMFFNRDIYSMGMDELMKQYHQHGGHKYLIDSSTAYSVCRYTAERIFETCGKDIKFIFCFRDRWLRMYSHWSMIKNYRPGRELSKFSDAIERNLESFSNKKFSYEFEYMPYTDYKGGCYIPYYIEASLYYNCLKPYLEFFDLENFEFINIDEFSIETTISLSSFLGIELEHPKNKSRVGDHGNSFDEIKEEIGRIYAPKSYEISQLFREDSLKFRKLLE